MAKQRPHPLIDVLFGHRVQLTLTHDVRVVLPGRQIHRHVVGDHHQRQQDDIGIVIGEDQQHRRLQGILHHIAHGGDLQRHVVALKGGKRGVVIGEHQVIQHALRQIDGEEDVQVHIRRTLVFHQPWQKRHHRQTHAQDHQTHDAVDLPVEFQHGAQGRLVILGNGLVHGEHQGAVKAQIGQIQHRQHGGEQGGQAVILLPQFLDDDGLDGKRPDEGSHPVDGAPKGIPHGIFGS